ncbi:glycoside hydrolase family 18 [Bacteroides pyogenes]|uniref:glycoside hydrolase family 18 n=1 Tax=Bacteroides pyogenes TaxID=310300 RepID=UPI0011E3DBCB|nr:glycoside hydrolase family 18 [Bacteroides pyogenes]MBR8709536.1 hypothetical protein [Bacteroides pyogenes]MBR8718379.1 hypothetical protein [Bacteroides pyogenes]MBR8747867.1 hypothetical protein [Bacteroides pyogenes]MBR8758181.1 hypothetical protein [Bacteroides pyogenes]MBR8781407.1 hypothetical protein [Bacteroides pyogenes]
MKNLKTAFAALLLICGFFACSDIDTLDIERQAVEDLYNNRDKDKWAIEDSIRKQNYLDSIRIAEENKAKYQLYLQDLREYKDTKHPVMFGWFNAWSSVTPGDYANLTLIPDSMDIVSIWGNCFNIDEARLKQMRTVQEKGTKIIVGWIIENVGNGIANRTKEEWSSDPETGVKEYARAILDSVAKYGYDGFDIDYEPSFASPFKPGNHCGDWPQNWPTCWPEYNSDLDQEKDEAKWREYWRSQWAINKPVIACSAYDNKNLENLFFKTLREGLDAMEAKDGKHRILNINGSIHYLDPELEPCFDYFVAQSYHGSYSRWYSNITNRLGKEVADRIIYTETFENNLNNRKNFMRFADYVMIDREGVAGGIGAYHINEDSFDGNQYMYVREAITRMNPPIK